MKKTVASGGAARRAPSAGQAPAKRGAKARRPQARPDEILDAALEEFAAQGFDAARMEDVAARAGISKAGVYLYFDSKEKLLDALIEREIAPVAERVKMLATAGEGDPVGALRMIAAAVTAQVLNSRIVNIPRLVVSISNRFPDVAAHYRARVIDVAFEAAQGLARAGVKRGVFRDLPPRAIIRAFIGPLFFEAIYTHVFKGEAASADELAAQHFDVLLNGITSEKT
ncbi:MAG: TetR/AcrR family transcriptional regulator [Caulobacterales bacterium]